MDNSKKKYVLTFMVIYMVISILMCVSGMINYRESKSFYENSSVIYGTIVEVKEEISETSAGNIRTEIWANVTYEDKHGITQAVYVPILDKTKPQKGDTIKLYYDGYEVSTTKDKRWSDALLFAIGLVMTLAGIITIIVVQRRGLKVEE